MIIKNIPDEYDTCCLFRILPINNNTEGLPKRSYIKIKLNTYHSFVSKAYLDYRFITNKLLYDLYTTEIMHGLVTNKLAEELRKMPEYSNIEKNRFVWCGPSIYNEDYLEGFLLGTI